MMSHKVYGLNLKNQEKNDTSCHIQTLKKYVNITALFLLDSIYGFNL